MASLYILLPVALLFFAAFCALFLWAVNHHQFDDLEREARRILYDDTDQTAIKQDIPDSGAN